MDNYTAKSYLFIHEKRYFTEVGFDIENGVITNAILGVHSQYRHRMYITLGGNNFTLCSSSCPVGPYLGELMTFLAEFFEDKAGGFVIDSLKGQYIRLLLNGEEVVGFGHILKDQFVLLEDVFGAKSKLWRRE